MKKFLQEFKAFALKGNVVDLAVGVMIGGAFTTVVTALVNSIFMPILSIFTGSVDFSTMTFTIGTAVVPYGELLQALFNFIMIALCVFLFVKALNKLKKPQAPKEAPRLCPYCKSEIAKDATRCPHCTSDLTK